MCSVRIFILILTKFTVVRGGAQMTPIYSHSSKSSAAKHFTLNIKIHFAHFPDYWIALKKASVTVYALRSLIKICTF
jgi:hypothetical protein